MAYAYPPKDHIKNIMTNHPQNFDVAKKQSNSPTIACAYGCGAILLKCGTKKRLELCQIIHNQTCSKAKEVMQELKELENDVGEGAAEVHSLEIREDKTMDMEGSKVEYQVGIGCYAVKSDRSRKKRRSILVSSSHIKNVGNEEKFDFKQDMKKIG